MGPRHVAVVSTDRLFRESLVELLATSEAVSVFTFPNSAELAAELDKVHISAVVLDTASAESWEPVIEAVRSHVPHAHVVMLGHGPRAVGSRVDGEVYLDTTCEGVSTLLQALGINRDAAVTHSPALDG